MYWSIKPSLDCNFFTEKSCALSPPKPLFFKSFLLSLEITWKQTFDTVKKRPLLDTLSEPKALYQVFFVSMVFDHLGAGKLMFW